MPGLRNQMNYNNQELNSLLSIGGDSFEQPFPTLSPRRSSSPRSIMSEQLSNSKHNPQHNSNISHTISNATSTSNLGSFRTRTRAGTLPSRFTAPPGQSFSPAFSSSGNSLDPSSLNLETLSISSTNDHQLSSTPTKTRLRSGSLLGLSESNSIWGDSQSNPASALNTLPNSSLSLSDLPNPRGRISPPKSNLQSQVIEEHQNSRVRAYSTNNAIVPESTQQFYLQNIDEHHSFDQHRAPMPNTMPFPTEHLPVFDSNRPRASTFQNGAQGGQPVFVNQQVQSVPPEAQAYNMKDLYLPTSNDQPLLLDNIDSRLLNWTSTYQDPSMGPSNTLLFSNLPPQAVSPVSLANLLIRFGKVLTVRVFQGDDSALVEFETLEAAMNAKAQINYQELMPGYACLVTFAKILPPPNVPQNPPQTDAQPRFNQTSQQQAAATSHEFSQQVLLNDEQDLPIPDIINTVIDSPPELHDIVPQLKTVIAQLGINPNTGSIGSIINNALNYDGIDNDFGPLPDPIPIREFDAPKLRETRKAIDAKTLSQADIEELSVAILDELPELSSDYLGNTVVQKLFQFSSNSVKYIMLKEVSPYLAQMGIHKNGTWSAQKMISVADSPLQKKLIADSLRPYTVPLLNDQFGNYVIQCSLKFGSPWNDFIFETILAKFWLIAQNRFGARAVRACLESHKATVEQTAIISAAIILHAEHLAINQNAALLITWFLDTCTLPNRYSLLTPRLMPHLAQLCSHKLASLTILKILNNRYEFDVKDMILETLFGENVTNDEVSVENLLNPPPVLEQVLKDNVHGATFVFKVLSNPQLDSTVRIKLIHQTRKVLVQLNLNTGHNYQGYKRLLDEVGLSSKLEVRNRARSNSGARNNNNNNSNNINKNISRSNKSPQGNTAHRRSGSNNGFRPSHAHPTSSNGNMFNQPPQSQDQFYNKLPRQGGFSNVVVPPQNGYLENGYTDYEPSFVPQPVHRHQTDNNSTATGNGNYQSLNLSMSSNSYLNPYRDENSGTNYHGNFPQQYGNYGTAQF